MSEEEENEKRRLAEENIRVEAPREPEVDPAHFRDTESLIYRGFLAVSASINKVRFVFKSLNHHELGHLQWMYDLEDVTTRDAYYNTFLAYGVYMVDGQNILPERDRWVPQLEELFANLAPMARASVIRHMSEVNRRSSRALTLTEAYQMERSSRFRWAQMKGLDLMSSSCTGIAGTEHFGLNYAQLIWRALNYYEDLRDTAEREWDNAKFIGSCFAGKEIKKVYDRDRDRRDKERNDRINRRDQILRHVLLGEELSSDREASGYQLVTARTAEELAGQLESDLRGERDWHDEVVAREEDRLREAERARSEQLKELQLASIQKNSDKLLTGGSDPSRSYSPEEIKERTLRARQLRAQSQSARLLRDEKMDSFLRKHNIIEDEPDTPLTKTERDPSHAKPVVKPRPPGSPFRR